MTNKTLMLAIAAIALPSAAYAEPVVQNTGQATTTAAATAPAAIAPTTTAVTPASYPAAVEPASTAYPAASYPPQMPGSVAGSVAADRDGDGVVDGYYTSDGIYHPNTSQSLPPPRLASHRGERG